MGTPDDPGWLRRLGGPTFVVILLSLLLLALDGAGVAGELDTQVLGLLLSVYVGGEKAAKAVGRFVARKRW